MDWSLSKVIRIESGSVGISTNDLKFLLRHYQIDDPQTIAELVKVARAARERALPGVLPPPGQLWRGLSGERVLPDDSPPPRQLWRDLSSDDFEHAIEAQLAPANLILPPAAFVMKETDFDNHFDTNESFWGKVLDEELRANAVVVLEDFLLFEWFPRSPGLFHTKRGKFAREDAAYHRMVQPAGEFYYAPDPTVYDLYGKVRMLEGGLGCVRLLPKQTENGILWFMSASSTQAAHEGVPIALSESDYRTCIGYITDYGAMPCDLTGKLKFLPKPLLSLYGDYTDVPGLYLLVEEVKPARSPRKLTVAHPTVSVAVTFGVDRSHVSAAYVSFVPGNYGSIELALEWLDRYIDRNDGFVVTDFDEQMRRYSGAIFSLDKISRGLLKRSEMMPFTSPW